MENPSLGNRGAEYEGLRARKGQKMLMNLEKQFPRDDYPH